MVTVAEAATELGISTRAVLHRIAHGEIKARKLTPRMYVVPRAEIERWKPVGKRKGGRPPKSKD